MNDKFTFEDKVYVTLPPNFVAPYPNKHPGYFYNLNDGFVYSIKSGVLKKLSVRDICFIRGFTTRTRGWINRKNVTVSTNGRPCTWFLDSIEKRVMKKRLVDDVIKIKGID